MNLDSTTIIRRDDGQILKESDLVYSDYTVRIAGIKECSIFSPPQGDSVDPERFSATVELELAYQFSCELENPDADEDPTAPPTQEFVRKFQGSREFNVHAIYDPADSTCRITGLYPYGEYRLAFVLRLRGERWILMDDVPSPDAA